MKKIFLVIIILFFSQAVFADAMPHIGPPQYGPGYFGFDLREQFSEGLSNPGTYIKARHSITREGELIQPEMFMEYGFFFSEQQVCFLAEGNDLKEKFESFNCNKIKVKENERTELRFRVICNEEEKLENDLRSLGLKADIKECVFEEETYNCIAIIEKAEKYKEPDLLGIIAMFFDWFFNVFLPA